MKRHAVDRTLLFLVVVLASSPSDRTEGQLGSAFAAPDEALLGDCNGNGVPDDVDTSVHFQTRAVDADLPFPISTFAADLDGDGDRDVLSASNDPSIVAWYENIDGLGSFSAPQVVGSGDGAGSVHAADLDGDGDNDILATRQLDETVWFENTDGAGSFGSEQVIAGALQADAVRGVDLDGDGDNDILTAQGGIDQIRWFENEGAGSFGSHQIVATSVGGVTVALGADLDGDDDLDVLFAASQDDSVGWIENLDGNGTWGPVQILTDLANGARAAIAVDLDGDDDLDVAAAYFFGDTIAWFENTDGNGTFGPEQIISDAVDGPRSVAAADLDNDGDQDVIAPSFNDDTVSWFENTDGDGTFGPPEIISDTADQVVTVVAANLDGDGDPDVIAAVSGIVNSLLWYENLRDDCNNNGVPDSCEDPSVRAACTDVDLDGVSVTTDCDDGNPNCTTDCTDEDGDGFCVTSDCDDTNPNCILDCTDVDLDGLCPPFDCDDLDPDCTTDCADADNDGVRACSGDCDDTDPECGPEDCTDCDRNGIPDICDEPVTFATRDVSTLEGGLETPAADLDGDGDRDVLAGLNSAGGLVWYENADGVGASWGSAQILELQFSVTAKTADVDGDGDFDILADVGGTVSWFENLGDGGAFGPQRPIAVDFRPRRVVAADLDDDGDLDVLASSHLNDKIAWYENLDGAGSFELGQLVASGSIVNSAHPVVAVDLDGDDDLDILAASATSSGRVLWFENVDGEGDFGSHQLIDEPVGQPRSLFAADLDGDDDLDILVGAFTGDEVLWYENLDGVAGSFGFGGVIHSNNAPTSVVAADLDGDGDAEVLSSGFFGVVRNDNLGRGVFGPTQPIDGGLTWRIDVANVDGDGDLDVVAGRSDDIRWYENLRPDCNNDGVYDACQDPDVASDCVDVDNDGVSSTADCDDRNPNCTTDCTDCDGDGYCVTTDCDDSVSYCTADCSVCADSDCNANDVPDATDSSVRFTTEELDSFFDEPDAIQATDLDGDGDRDLLVGGGNGAIAWYENTDHLGSFGPRQTILSAVGEVISAFAADFDGDGDRDVLSGESVAFGLFWLENEGALWLQHTIDPNVAGTVSVFAADVDGDGRNDALAAVKLNNKIAWWRNTGSGSFSSQQVIHEAAPGDPTMITAADVDGDGDLDVLAVYEVEEAITWHENLDGNGNFGAQQLVDTAAGAASVSGADLDTDGDLDLLATLAGDFLVVWYENLDGNGTWGPRRTVSPVGAPEWAVAADLDDDGDQDVLSVSGHDGILWSENVDGVGAFGPPRFASSSPLGGKQVVAADLDGDGDLDGASSLAGTVSWHENLRDDCNRNQLPDVCEDPSVTDACTDLDADGFPLAEDCDDDDHTLWTDPGPVDGLRLSAHGQPGDAALSWPPPAEPGAAAVRYDTLRSTDPSDFLDPATVCVESDELDRLAQDDGVPSPGKLHHYLIRVENDCPGGVGAMGADSEGVPRAGSSCP